MLYNTHAMAGTSGNKSAIPRLSPSAISAICCAAKAGSHALNVEKTAPAMAVPVREMLVGFDKVRDFGRFWRERREMGLLGSGFEGLLVLSMAMVVDSVAAIGGGLVVLEIDSNFCDHTDSCEEMCVIEHIGSENQWCYHVQDCGLILRKILGRYEPLVLILVPTSLLLSLHLHTCMYFPFFFYCFYLFIYLFM
ncbi:hypothetical protein Hanom_Chr06g00505861 [Helianthus anomalus]